MATVNTYTTERRITPDRRSTSLSKGTLSTLDWIAMTLVLVGAINWGLIGLFSFNLVSALFGEMTPIARIVYTLVGVSAVWMIFACTKLTRRAH